MSNQPVGNSDRSAGKEKMQKKEQEQINEIDVLPYSSEYTSIWHIFMASSAF